MEEVAGGDDEDTAVAIALVTLCGSLAILLLPAAALARSGWTPREFGSWVGASVHDVGQTVATADRVPGALTTAVVVKLSRVVLLAPLVAGVVAAPAPAQPDAAGTGRRPPLLPLFVAGFLAALALASTGLRARPGPARREERAGVLLAAALVGLGTGIHLPTLRRTGGRALAARPAVLAAGGHHRVRGGAPDRRLSRRYPRRPRRPPSPSRRRSAPPRRWRS